MTEDKKEKKIDYSEFKDWRNNKVTEMVYNGLLDHKIELEETLLNISNKNTNSQNLYWEIRGKLHVVNYFIDYINDFSNIEIMEDAKND